MQLRLGGDGVQLSLDSAIDGFEEIVAQATGFAGVAGLSLETTTMENLNAMGLMPVETADDDMADDRAFVNKDAHSR